MRKLLPALAPSLLISLVLLAAGPAQAQFRLDINRLIDTAKSAQRAAGDVSEKDEIEIGKELASTLLGAAPLLANEPVQRYVQSVGRWLATQTERPDLPWQFGVLDAPQINAFAAPGGYIFVTRGLLERMRSEAELAGVLAHEIAHVLQKHHLKAIQKSGQVGVATGVLSLAIQDRNSLARDKLIAFGTEMYSRGLDRTDELEADRLGVVIAARAGYDPYGLPAVLLMLQAMNPEDSGLALMFKTHPQPADRLEAIEKQSPLLDAYAGQPQLEDRFAASLGAK
jgi:predicted Zn-dependent protease